MKPNYSYELAFLCKGCVRTNVRFWYMMLRYASGIYKIYIICISVIFIDRWRVTHLVKTYNIMWTVIFLQQSHFKKIIKKERDIYQWNKPRGACFTLVEVYISTIKLVNSLILVWYWIENNKLCHTYNFNKVWRYQRGNYH